MAWRVEKYDCLDGFDIMQMPVETFREEAWVAAEERAKSLDLTDSAGVTRYGVLVYDEGRKTGGLPAVVPGKVAVWQA
jgi:hypothetical protein